MVCLVCTYPLVQQIHTLSPHVSFTVLLTFEISLYQNVEKDDGFMPPYARISI